MGNRANQVEHAITDITTTVNDLIDANKDNEEERLWLRTKIADLEGCSRHKNLKLRGKPETVTPQDLIQYTIVLFHIIAPELCPLDLTIDRIPAQRRPQRHSHENSLFLHKRTNTTEITLPRKASGTSCTHPNLRGSLQTHLGHPQTAKYNHKDNNTIPYKLKHPIRLIVEYNGKLFNFTSLEKGLSLLGEWGIIPYPDPPLPVTRDELHV